MGCGVGTIFSLLVDGGCSHSVMAIKKPKCVTSLCSLIFLYCIVFK